MLYDQVDQAVTAIRSRAPLQPVLALILGSGLGDLAHELRDVTVIPYVKIPYFVRSTVAGHVGRLLIGFLEDVPVVAMQGRFHLYEGYAPAMVTFPVRVMHRLGAQALIVTNAAGGVNPVYHPGDFMVLCDHIFLPGLAGMNPLIGPHDERLGARFPAISQAYDADLRAMAHTVARTQPDITLHEGIYTMVAGPSFETPAELRFLRAIGTDAVGMSTAPEVVVARQEGMRVLGISLISNMATGDEDLTVNHGEVLSVADAARPAFSALVRGIVRLYR